MHRHRLARGCFKRCPPGILFMLVTWQRPNSFWPVMSSEMDWQWPSPPFELRPSDQGNTINHLAKRRPPEELQWAPRCFNGTTQTHRRSLPFVKYWSWEMSLWQLGWTGFKSAQPIMAKCFFLTLGVFLFFLFFNFSRRASWIHQRLSIKNKQKKCPTVVVHLAFARQ